MHMKGLYIILITSKFVQVLTRVLRLSLNVEQSNFSSLSEIYICYSLILSFKPTDLLFDFITYPLYQNATGINYDLVRKRVFNQVEL